MMTNERLTFQDEDASSLNLSFEWAKKFTKKWIRYLQCKSMLDLPRFKETLILHGNVTCKSDISCVKISCTISIYLHIYIPISMYLSMSICLSTSIYPWIYISMNLYSYVSIYISTYLYICSVSIYLYVIFKNRAEVLYRDLKHEAIAECFRPDKARIASFLNVLWNSPPNTLICAESLEIYLS